MEDITKRGLIAGGAALAATLGGRALAQGAPPLRTAFEPGAPWLDTAGKPIQAHGASMLHVDGRYYWYGENKEFTTGKTRVWTWGVRCYASTDLYNWEDLGLIIPPDETDRKSPLHPFSMLDRPHILYNRRTQKFVCWLKIMGAGGQTRTVLTADRITGPYTIVRQGLRPVGMSAGDFDLCVSPDDGKAYMYFERVHSEMICADLTEDYTDFTGYYSTHFPSAGPPHVREGLAYFRRRGRHYIASSGTSSYFPNPSQIAVADTFHGPFTTLGDLHPGDRSRTSFNSQISGVFKHPKKKDLYIAMADRWLGPQTDPAFLSGRLSRDAQSALHKTMITHQPLTRDEDKAMNLVTAPVATVDARYVWLPIRFDDDRPVIAWRDRWTLDEFA